jgi:uncharacterized membrane protein
MAGLGVDGPRLAKTLFEPNCLLLLAVCLAHAVSAHGWRRTAREFSAGFALTALAESTGVLSGAYVYPGFQLYVFATPVCNPASWVALVYIVMTLSDRLIFGRRALVGSGVPLQIGSNILTTVLALAVCDALLALSLDLVLDPLATIYNWWLWVPHEPAVTTIGAGVVDPYNFDHLVWLTTPDNPVAEIFRPFFEGGRYPTRVLGIPLINFIAWFVFVFTFAFQFRWVETRDWGHARKTLVLWAVVLVDWPILSFLLIAPNL